MSNAKRYPWQDYNDGVNAGFKLGVIVGIVATILSGLVGTFCWGWLNG